MDEESMICPECSKEISSVNVKCPNCGYPLFRSKPNSKCPECGNDINTTDEKCSRCGYPLGRKNEKIIENTTAPPRKLMGIALVVVGIIFAFLAYKTRFIGDYDYYASLVDGYESDICDYKSTKQEMLDEANSYSSSFFKSSYKNLANGYQDLMDETKEKLEKYKWKQRGIVIKAAIMLIVSLSSLVAGGYLIGKNR